MNATTEDAIRGAAAEVLDEGLIVTDLEARVGPLAAFAERQRHEMGALDEPMFGFMEDGRVEVTFDDLPDGTERVTFFVEEKNGAAKRIAVAPNYKTTTRMVPFP